MQQVERYLTPSEAARALGVSTELLRLWFRTGRIRFVTTGLGRLVPPEEVERIRAERRTKGGGRRRTVTTPVGS